MQNEEKTENSEAIIHKCPHCGASMRTNAHRLSKGLIRALIKFKKAVLHHNRNRIHSAKETDFTKIEYNNFQKLRYHGLVAKCYDKETNDREAGYWLLTRRGNQFCKNEIVLPMRVSTFRNKICDKSEEVVRLSDIIEDNEMPVWDERMDFGFEYADVHDLDEIKTDMNGQTLLKL